MISKWVSVIAISTCAASSAECRSSKLEVRENSLRKVRLDGERSFESIGWSGSGCDDESFISLLQHSVPRLHRQGEKGLPADVSNRSIAVLFVSLFILVCLGVAGTEHNTNIEDKNENYEITAEARGEGDFDQKTKHHMPLDKKKSKPQEFPAIDSARFLGAALIACHHFFLANGGPLWLAFFFMVSGFGASTARMGRGFESTSWCLSGMLPSPRTLYKRIASVYPMYLLAFLLELWVRRWGEGTRPDISTFGLELIMLGAFKYYMWNPTGWFMTSLLVCWLFENVAFKVMARIHERTWAALPLVSVMAYALTGCLAHDGFVFYGHWWQGLPPYFVGTALAFAINDNLVPSMLSRVAGTMGLLAVLIMSNYSYRRIVDSRLATHLFYFIRDPTTAFCALCWPLQLLLLVGLCGNSDPVAKVFSLNPLPAFGRHVAMGMYLLQYPLKDFIRFYPVPIDTTTPHGMLLFLVILTGIAAVAQSFVQNPMQRIMLQIIQQ